MIASRRTVLRCFLLPGVILMPIVFGYAAVTGLSYLYAGMFIAGMLTVGQFSFWGNYLPGVYPMHLRGTGESFAANIGGRLIGTSFAAVTGIPGRRGIYARRNARSEIRLRGGHHWVFGLRGESGTELLPARTDASRRLTEGTTKMAFVVWFLMALLTVVQQIDWGFAATPLFGGVIPPGLLFHAGVSVAASFLWLLAVTFCWPKDAEVEAPARCPPNRRRGHDAVGDRGDVSGAACWDWGCSPADCSAARAKTTCSPAIPSGRCCC